ncbi:hypothetical protein [Vibrio aestuarianus]|uniref:hypothetical protein n=1 Tax=Vibrio aestuarianus TaxID=28171 RepID=UPI0030B820CF
MFKNPFRPSQLAENTERTLNEIVALTLKTHQTHNAALRREQRNTTATALRLKHKTYRKPKLPRVVNRS